MADSPITYNQWGTVTFNVPDSLESARDKINTVAEFLVAVLDIALQASELAKTFATGYLDPMAALTQAVVAEIQSLVTDMRQLGLYLTGDWKLLEWPYSQLQGGFQEYERRMIARLTDLADTTRPDVSPDTKVLALFFYLSVDASEIQHLIGFVQQLAGLFTLSATPKGSMPVATLGAVQYGANALDILHPKSLVEALTNDPTPPRFAKLRWGLNSTSQRHPFNPIPPLPPGGFIVAVSVYEEGLKVVFDAPQSDTSLEPSTKDVSKKVQPREYGEVRVQGTGAPLVIHGGADQVPSSKWAYGNMGAFASPSTKGSEDRGWTKVYAQKVAGDDGIIPLDALWQSNEVRLLQRLFYVPSTEKWASWATGEFGFVLDAHDMPYNCDWELHDDGTIKPKNIRRATTAYIRVAACSPAAFKKHAQYHFSPPNARGGKPYVEAALTDGLNPTDVAAWSAPVRVTFPSANTHEYLDTLKTALLVLVLSRPDLELYDPSLQSIEVQKLVLDGKCPQPHKVLALCGLEPAKHLADLVLSDYRKNIERQGVSPSEFRDELFRSIERVAHNLHNVTGSDPRLEKIVVERTAYLREVTWGQIFKAAGKGNLDLGDFGDMTLGQTVNPDYVLDTDVGLAQNPYGIGLPERVVDEWFYIPGVLQERDPHMIEYRVGTTGAGFSVKGTVAAADVPDFLAGLSPAVFDFYTEFVQDDGSIAVPPKRLEVLQDLASRVYVEGSADLSPIVFVNATGLSKLATTTANYNPLTGGSVHYCRGLFAKANDGQVLKEAALALSIAASATTHGGRGEGQWLALRAFDIFPAMDDFFATVENWAVSLQGSIKSVSDTIREYIEFLEGRLVELQGLIRRINDLLQGLLGFAFEIPKCSFLALVSDGTYGVTGDLVSASSKPSDSPLAYGAGAALVVPFGPPIAMELIQTILHATVGTPKDGETVAGKKPKALLDGTRPPAAGGGDHPPEVL